MLVKLPLDVNRLEACIETCLGLVLTMLVGAIVPRDRRSRIIRCRLTFNVVSPCAEKPRHRILLRLLTTLIPFKLGML